MPRLLKIAKKRSATVLRLSRELGTDPVRFVLRYGWLAKVKGFSEEEIFALALMDPALAFRELKHYESKRNVRPVYRELNSSKARELIDDKDLFHRECDRHKLAAAPVTTRLTREDLAELAASVESGSQDRYRRLLAALPSRFVVKPSLGYHGDGILFLKKTDDGTVSTWEDEPLAPAAFVELLRTSISAPTMPLAQGASPTESRRSADKHVLLVQPLLRAHGSLHSLTGREQVQSLRICTTISPEGQASIHFVFLKLLAGRNMQDNFAQGANGNMLAYMDKQSGRIHRVICRDAGSGLMRIKDRHPDTQIPFAGFEVPFWHEACDLAIQAAKSFRETRAVGWDIGLTPEGPLLLEGNGTWDPLAPLYAAFPPVRESENR